MARCNFTALYACNWCLSCRRNYCRPHPGCLCAPLNILFDINHLGCSHRMCDARERARVRCKGQCSSVLAALGRVRNSCRPPPGSGPADCRGESAFYIDKYQRKRMFNCVQIGWLSAALRTINIVITIVVIERARVEPDGGRRTRRPELFKFKFRPHENAIVPRVQSQYACNLITYTFTKTTHMCVWRM